MLHCNIQALQSPLVRYFWPWVVLSPPAPNARAGRLRAVAVAENTVPKTNPKSAACSRPRPSAHELLYRCSFQVGNFCHPADTEQDSKRRHLAFGSGMASKVTRVTFWFCNRWGKMPHKRLCGTCRSSKTLCKGFSEPHNLRFMSILSNAGRTWHGKSP
jgi:hypothetical protein